MLYLLLSLSLTLFLPITACSILIVASVLIFMTPSAASSSSFSYLPPSFPSLCRSALSPVEAQWAEVKHDFPPGNHANLIKDNELSSQKGCRLPPVRFAHRLVPWGYSRASFLPLPTTCRVGQHHNTTSFFFAPQLSVARL